MKRVFILVIVLIGFVRVAQSAAWSHVTPLGIRISANKAVVAQYESKWGEWENIDWQSIDDYFTAYSKFFNVKLKPKGLLLNIVRWSDPCISHTYCGDYPKGECPEGPAIEDSDTCVEGELVGYSAIVIHLGKDSGQGQNAFCKTATGWEMARWFLYRKGDPCWDAEWGLCFSRWPDDGALGLCQ